MTTELVYVLTCAPEKHYIEQALMSVFSARHWNPDAHIVLLVDDQTNQLLVGKRAELMDYISEKIVVPFEDVGLSMMYRSRFIKTSVRQLINGDFLYIDCDTIVCKTLADIDNFDVDIGAVLESHLLVKDFGKGLRKAAIEANSKIGVDLDVEKQYFSSGVLFVKDTPVTQKIYSLWHTYWKEGESLELRIDQPALAKANRESGHIIKRIPDSYNCILFTQNPFVNEAHILHISSYRNPNFLFKEQMLSFVKREGLTEWVKESILHPCDCMLPFDYDICHSSFQKRIQWIRTIARTMKSIEENLPELVNEFPMQSSFKNTVLTLFRYCPIIGAGFWLFWRRLKLFSNKEGLMDNVCRKAI